MKKKEISVSYMRTVNLGNYESAKIQAGITQEISEKVMAELKYINYNELVALRKKQWLKQKKTCPILKQVMRYEDSCFDHLHKTKAEPLGEDGKGLLRGVLHFQANSWEGKCTNAFKRYGLHKFGVSLPEALRNLAEYIEHPPMPPEYVHPSERPKAKRIGKRDFNRICKFYFEMYPGRKKLPVYPKSGKINKELEALLIKVNNYKNQNNIV